MRERNLDHEHIAMVVARKTTTVGQVPLYRCTLSGTLTALHTAPGRAPWAPGGATTFLAMSISEDPTEIELCKLHAMNSTRRGRTHAMPSHPFTHSTCLGASLSTHPSSTRRERGDSRV